MNQRIPGKLPKLSLDLPFRGDRNYVTGADVFDHLERELRQSHDLSAWSLSEIVFLHKTCNNINACFDDTKPESGLLGSFRIISANRDREMRGWLIDSGSTISRVLPFDEKALLRTSYFDIEMKKARIAVPSEYTSIQAIVAGTKELCESLAPEGGKWIFGSLRLEAALSTLHGWEISLSLTRMVMNRFASIEISSDTQPIGTIQFIKEVT